MTTRNPNPTPQSRTGAEYAKPKLSRRRQLTKEKVDREWVGRPGEKKKFVAAIEGRRVKSERLNENPL